MCTHHVDVQCVYYTCKLWLLQDLSKRRRNHLASLYDYIQSCNKEMVYLSGQQDRIIQRDWSDRMIDPPGVRTEYEVRGQSPVISHRCRMLDAIFSLLCCLLIRQRL